MKNPKRLLLPLGVLLAAAVAVLVLRNRSASEELGASGTVEATEADLGFQTAGRIEDIGPHEGDAVEAGAELAHLDRSEIEARRAAAQAQTAAAHAQLEELENGFRPQEVTQGRAAYEAASERLENARRELDRTRTLYDGGAVSREELDQYETTFAVREAEGPGAAPASRPGLAGRVAHRLRRIARFVYRLLTETP